MGFSFRKKKAGRNMLWPRLRSLSAYVRHLSPPCVVGFGRASGPCPPLVRLVLLALAAPPVLVRDLSALCPPLVRRVSATCPPCVVPQAVYCDWGSLLEEHMPWPRPGVCPPCVRHCPPCVRHCVRLGSASKFGWPRLQLCRPCVRLVSAMCLPCVPPCITLICHLPGMCRPSAFSPPCVFHVSAMCLLKRSHHSPSLTAMRPPCVCHVSSMCRSCVRSLSAMRPLFVSASPPLKPWPRLWALSALGLLWGRVVASSSKFFSRRCATHSVYIAFCGQLAWHTFWLPEFGLCKRTL